MGDDIQAKFYERSLRVASQSRSTAYRLACKADQLERIRLVVDVLSIVCGLIALAVGVLQSAQIAIVIAIASAFLLIGGVAFDRVVLKDPPQRFRDYSFYMGQYADRIEQLTVDRQTTSNWERLKVIVGLADQNFNDARKNWPGIVGHTE